MSATKNSRSKLVAFGIVILVPILLILYFNPNRKLDKNTRMILPKYFPKVENGDTVYHKIPEFSFTSHLGETITDKDFEKKIYVTDFFYATCPSICPIMSNNMTKLQEAFVHKDDIMFLSHTVDPARDSVEALKMYADKYDVIPGKWHLVTGEKDDLYRMARKAYFISTMEGGGEGEEDFIHSDRFILVDKEKYIRGIYNGTDSADIEQLQRDIVYLLTEVDL